MATAILQPRRKIPPAMPQLTLQEFNDATGWAYSYEDISEMTGLSVRTITRIANPAKLREAHRIALGLLADKLTQEAA